MTKTWLVFDIGTGSTKAALIRNNQVIQMANSGYETHFGDNGKVEQNADDWWQSVQTTTHELDVLNNLDGIILTGQMQDVILVDAKANSVRPVILYNDTRAIEQIKQIHDLISDDDLVQITGIHQTAGSLLAKLRWLQQYEPDSIEKSTHLLFGGADFIVAKMTGNFASDNTTASTSGLWNLIHRSLMTDDVLDKIGLSSVLSLLPQVVDGGSFVGHLTQDASQVLELEAGIPVYLAPGDAGSATIGAGSGEIGSAYAYVGTSGWVAFSSDQTGDPNEGVITLAHPKTEHFIQIAPMMTSAGNLDWVQELFDSDNHEQLIQLGTGRAPSNLIFLPYLNGERAPFSDPFARGTFIGLSAQSGKADIYRAVLEGIVFAYRHTLSALSPQQPANLTIIGGGARSIAWCQMFADILQIPVHLPKDAENGGLHGAVRSVEVLLSIAYDYDVSFSGEKKILIPKDQYRDLYTAKYQLFLDSYRTLKPIFQSATKLLKN